MHLSDHRKHSACLCQTGHFLDDQIHANGSQFMWVQAGSILNYIKLWFANFVLYITVASRLDVIVYKSTTKCCNLMTQSSLDCILLWGHLCAVYIFNRSELSKWVAVWTALLGSTKYLWFKATVLNWSLHCIPSWNSQPHKTKTIQVLLFKVMLCVFCSYPRAVLDQFPGV